MRLACGDHSFPALPHEQAVELVRLLGFEAFDLAVMGNRSHVRPEAIRGDIPRWAGLLEERIRGRGLDVADVFCIPWTDFETMAPNSPDDAERERGHALFRDMLELSARLGAPGLTMVPGIDWPHEGHEESLARAAVELGRRAGESQERGLRFSIEPHVGSVCGSPQDVARLVELAPGLELTLDYTHYVSQGYAESEIEPLIGHARHFHARGGAVGRVQCGLAESTIDYERIVEAMRETGYDGALAIEYVWIDWERCNECDNVSETVILRDRLRAAIAGEPWSYPASPT
jgi:sugar phosphate isomerase/epimerase